MFFMQASRLDSYQNIEPPSFHFHAEIKENLSTTKVSYELIIAIEELNSADQLSAVNAIHKIDTILTKDEAMVDVISTLLSPVTAHRKDPAGRVEQFNTTLLALENQANKITKALLTRKKEDGTDLEGKEYESFMSSKEILMKRHESIEKKKAEYILTHFKEGDQAYQMRLPTTIEKGTHLYCAGSPEKIDGLLANGILINPKVNPTHLGSEVDQWGGSEMGKGLYFSEECAPYLSEDLPFAIEVEANAQINGVAYVLKKLWLAALATASQGR